jgi:hypothetical protein
MADATERPAAEEAKGGRRGSRKSIVWDEGNLSSNAEWHKANPVTMHIDEPKTEFVHDDGAGFGSDSDEEKEEKEDGWAEAEYNKVGGRSLVSKPVAAAAAAPPPGDGSLSLTSPNAASEEQQQEAEHAEEFKHMRKAVYADEGKKFIAMREAMKRQAEEEDDDDDE